MRRPLPTSDTKRTYYGVLTARLNRIYLIRYVNRRQTFQLRSAMGLDLKVEVDYRLS